MAALTPASTSVPAAFSQSSAVFTPKEINGLRLVPPLGNLYRVTNEFI
jgi:hypothetical protein